MGKYKNFKMVTYLVAQAAQDMTEEKLQTQLAFFDRYVELDKVYLEAFRGSKTDQEKVLMVRDYLEARGIEVEGGITTVMPNLTEEDTKRQRLFNTICYCNEPMRQRLKEMVEYTASYTNAFIIDDFYFTNCRCEDCQREKGERSWEEFRLAKMVEVSENLILGPARKVNPNIKVTIKYPNWMESYQETGYNVEGQKDLFDYIYTGTETRHPSQTDQHLPRYLSYSLMRYMEHVAPGRNGGGWLDAFECYPMDCYLEQAYLTAFSKPCEVMLFCWPLMYNNKLSTPISFQMHRIDNILDKVGEPVGLPVYLPYHAQGEDHLEDYLGMFGIPFDPVPEFPSDAKAMFLTASAMKDPDIVEKVRQYVSAGGKCIVTSGFATLALEGNNRFTDMTSVRFRNRRMEANEYHLFSPYSNEMEHITERTSITFPMLEHRNNASWSLLNVGDGDQHSSAVLVETYGRGQLIIVSVPDNHAQLVKLPRKVLSGLRYLLGGEQLYLDCDGHVSLFTYDNDTFGIYSYADDGCKPQQVEMHLAGKVSTLVDLETEQTLQPYTQTAQETIFRKRLFPGDFSFYKINR